MEKSKERESCAALRKVARGSLWRLETVSTSEFSRPSTFVREFCHTEACFPQRERDLLTCSRAYGTAVSVLLRSL